MVICDACKQYTDDRGEFCQQCGQPLVAAKPVSFEPGGQPQAFVAEIAADQEKAQLLASGVIAKHATAFLFHGRQQQSVLIPLFGLQPAAEQPAAATLFGAFSYLVQHSYNRLQHGAGLTAGLEWLEVRPWDGQERSLEGKLARGARLETTVTEVARDVIAEAMDFRCEVVVRDDEGVRRDRWAVDFVGLQTTVASLDATDRRSMSSWLDAGSPSQSYSYRDVSPYTAPSGVIALARQTVMPEHDEPAACRATYQMLLDFINADPKRADTVADGICWALDWFRRFREEPNRVRL